MVSVPGRLCLCLCAPGLLRTLWKERHAPPTKQIFLPKEEREWRQEETHAKRQTEGVTEGSGQGLKELCCMRVADVSPLSMERLCLYLRVLALSEEPTVLRPYSSSSTIS